MGLEATMIIVDNSEHTRNGDFTPTRFGAQSDAVNLIFGAKTNSNAESTVGVMTLAGKMPEVKVTSTKEMGKILAAMHSVKISGSPNFVSAIQIAQLALKHRQNKLQKQRIIVFIASPIEESSQVLVRLARKMKKNNISIDIVNFGEEAVNTSKLESFMEAIGTETSHLVTIPPGAYLLSDMLLSSPILMGEDGAPPPGLAGMAGGDASGFEFGIDPSLDPELALALRMSLEEEQARQAAEAQRAVRDADEQGLESVPEESSEKKDGEGQGGTDNMQVDK